MTPLDKPELRATYTEATVTHFERRRVEFDPPVTTHELLTALGTHLVGGWIPDQVLWELAPEAGAEPLITGMEVVRAVIDR